ncbi:thioredoxin-like domain-containing protein [uncultured Jatrophihabitans sp.]|uniref:thioredoxin-like domain-containing protein n=1 Tax=uncultured Jatrophihabitans sp. TaxID=1610747 RepID=UPI0035CB1BC2
MTPNDPTPNVPTPNVPTPNVPTPNVPTRKVSTPRVRAPELLPDAFWLNSDPLSLAALRGRFVLLDFWTNACANCWHVADELRALETQLADVLTVIGVHSPKFPHEADQRALAAAVERADITHPVLNDPGLELWRQYAVRAWPTLVLIDPEGYVIAQAAGEGQADALAMVVADRIGHYEQRGTLHRGPLPTHSAPQSSTDLRFPASAVVLPADRTGRDTDTLLVADAGHHQLAELTADGRTVLRRIGGGRGEPFAEPNGLTLVPPGLRYDVLVADTANHVLRGVRLGDGAVVTTIALPDLLADARTVTGPVPAVLSPWDVAWWPALQQVVVSASGVHLLLAYDPATDTARVLAGTTVEGLRDGPALDGWLAQPSGLAVDGDQLWFADAETSALRRLTVNGTLHTAVGEGLFDFGLVDGPAQVARMQHPLGVHVLPDGAVAVADTFNGAVRRFDPATAELSTLVTGLAEPSGLVDSHGTLLVVESAAHRLVPLASQLGPDGRVATPPRDDRVATPGRPVSVVRPGAVELTIAFTPAPGRKVDDSDGPPVRVDVSASPPELLRTGGGPGTELVRRLELAPDGQGVLSVTAQVASCDDSGAEHPACYLSRQDWGIPVAIDPAGEPTVRLVLFGE